MTLSPLTRSVQALALTCAALLCACTSPNNAAEARRTAQAAPATQVQDIPSTPASSRLATIRVSQLPREGQQTYRLIAQGGPFPYSRDGVTFGNYEGILPKQKRGYYREYTVKTPGESDRGARRIVCGGQPTTSTAECYYTADHYASFRRIQP